MECICSDTNIWIDFSTIRMLRLPFCLPVKFIMYEESITDELIHPPGLASKLLEYGLVETGITVEEFLLASEIRSQHKKLSNHDAIAFAIAKLRKILLATGDKRLREVSEKCGVQCIGTIGIVDRIGELGLISKNKLLECFRTLLQKASEQNSCVRLPKRELEIRIAKLARD